MRNLIRIVGLICLIVFVALQFFQPEKNRGETTGYHIFEKEKVPPELKAVIQNACLDCHSNQTNYLWYHKIAPVSWIVYKHIEEGKKELNLSNWGEMDIFTKIETLEEICQEVERKKMPLKSYTLIHRDAKLSDEQVAELCQWTEKLGLDLLEAVKK